MRSTRVTWSATAPSRPRRVAGRRAHRAAVRPQLRGRRRELRPARRPGLGGLPLRDRRRAAARGRAPHDHGVALRVRLARRRLAHAAALRAPRAAAHGVRRRDGDGAQPGRGRRVARGRPRDRQPRLALDQLPGRAVERRARAHAARDRDPPPSSPASGRSAGTPAAPARTRAGWWSSTAASSTTPTTTPTTCPGTTRATAKPQLVVPYTLDANDMRFATPQGFNTGDQFFTYLQGQPSTCSTPKATHAAMMSIGPALPARRPARRASRRSSASSTTCAARRSGSPAASTSRATGSSTSPMDETVDARSIRRRGC